MMPKNPSDQSPDDVSPAEKAPTSPARKPRSRTKPGRIDPATDPVKGSLDAFYDVALKYFLSTHVSRGKKIASVLSLYSLISTLVTTAQHITTPTAPFNDENIALNMTQFLDKPKDVGGCYFIDKHEKLQVVFTEKSFPTFVTDVIYNMSWHSLPLDHAHDLGSIPSIKPMPCDGDSKDKLDANKQHQAILTIRDAFLQQIKDHSQDYKSLQGAKGYFTADPTPLYDAKWLEKFIPTPPS